MADNIELDAGTGGAVIKTDEDGSSNHWQYVKAAFGGDGTQTRVTSSVGLPVEILAGSASIGTLGANSGVDIGDVDVVTCGTITPGVAATSLGKAEDAVHGSGDTGVMSLAVRNDTLAALAGTDGDYAPFQVNASGALYIQEGSALDVSGATVTVDLGTNNDVTVTSGTITAVTDITNTIDSTISGDALTSLQLIDNPVFVDDAAFTLTTSSVMVSGAIRDDSLSTLAAVEGDAVPLRVGSTGALHVTGGGGGTEYTEDVATPNPIVGTASMMERDDALSTLTPIEGDWASFRCSAEGALWTQEFNSDAILTNTDTIAGDTASIDGKITACNTGAVVISSGTITAVTDITNVVSVDDNGGTLTVDNAALSVTGGGVEATALRVTVASDSTGVLSIDDGGGSITIDGTVTASSTTGNAAHDAAATGNPVLIGSRATADVEALTEVAEADASYVATDLQGVLITRPYIAAQEHVQYHVVNTAGTELAVTGLDAGGAGIHNYVTAVMVHNAHASTNGFIQLLDGSAGTVLATFPAPATGGVVINFTQPIKQTTANTALYWDASGAITTLYVTIIGYQGQG